MTYNERRSTDAKTVKGNDIDSNGDGVVDNADKLQGNLPEDLGNTLDNSTIGKRENGDIGVIDEIIIADFENDLGEWSVSEDPQATVERTTDLAKNGTYSLLIEARYGSSDPNGVASRNIDLSNFQNLKIWIYPSRIYSGGVHGIFINSNIEYDLSTLTEGEWQEITIDVSSYDSSENLEFRIEDNDPNNLEGGKFYFDFGRLSSNPFNKNQGEGGTV